MSTSQASRDLPPELAEEILSFLPVRDLLRFRCVSKSWHDMISRPSFCLSARTRRSVIMLESTKYSPPSLHLIEEGKEGLAVTPKSDFDLATFLDSYITRDERLEVADSHDYGDEFLLLGSYDGLLLLGYEGLIFLLNPSTRQCTKIAPYRRYGCADLVCGGICYDPTNNDYKLVISIQPYIMSPTIWDTPDIRVTSFKAQTWEEVDFPYEGIDFKSSKAGIVVDEKIHWVVHQREGSQLVLVSFDAVNNGFVEVPMPEHPKFCTDIYDLGVLDGCLAMSSRQLCDYKQSASDECHFIYHVWMMKEYGVKESWTLLLTLEISRDNIKREYMCCLALFVTNYREVAIYLGQRKMIAYDLKDHRYREIVLPSHIWSVIAYEESLVSPFAPAPRSYKKKRSNSSSHVVKGETLSDSHIPTYVPTVQVPFD